MSVLSIINEEMDSIGVPYEYMQWTSAVTDPYWIGEYTEDPVVAEDGSRTSTVILTGTTMGTWLDLERTRAKIENHFHPIYGLSRSTESGVVVVFYDGAFPVPTGEANLKRIQVNLHVKEWRNTQ